MALKNKLNIILPLILGVIIYLIKSPGIIRNHLCDFLWAYSFAFSLTYIELNNKETFIITLSTGVIFELLQMMHLIRGTFDILDILVELLACIICYVYRSKYE